MNLVLITSVIHPFKEGFFSSEERLDQLINLTICSVKRKIPNFYLVVIEGGQISEDEKNLISKHCDYLHLFNVNNFDKSMGELSLLCSFLKSNFFNQIRSKVDNLIKISGRYYILDDFDFKKYPESCIKNEKSVWTDYNVSHTTFYKIFKSDIDKFIEKIYTLLEEGLFIDIEHTFYKENVVPCTLTINNLGIAGFIESGNYYEC